MIGVEGSVAIVTGAGQGNGRAIALGLARAGAHVAVCDINADAAAETAALAAEAGVRSMSAQCDVSDLQSARGFAEKTRAELGNARILVNNAGILKRHRFGDPGFESEWDQTFRVNVDGPRNMVLAYAAQLEATGGRIVNLASIMSLSAGFGISAYIASKGAVGQLTKALAHEFAPRGVRVNAIAPGVIDTPMTEHTRGNEAAIGKFMAHTPLGRTGQPDELVGPVLFLVSDMSSYVTGTILPVDGGYLAA